MVRCEPGQDQGRTTHSRGQNETRHRGQKVYPAICSSFFEVSADDDQEDGKKWQEAKSSD
jgi:hypothetical protein